MAGAGLEPVQSEKLASGHTFSSMSGRSMLPFIRNGALQIRINSESSYKAIVQGVVLLTAVCTSRELACRSYVAFLDNQVITCSVETPRILAASSGMALSPAFSAINFSANCASASDGFRVFTDFERARPFFFALVTVCEVIATSGKISSC